MSIRVLIWMCLLSVLIFSLTGSWLTYGFAVAIEGHCALSSRVILCSKACPSQKPHVTGGPTVPKFMPTKQMLPYLNEDLVN